MVTQSESLDLRDFYTPHEGQAAIHNVDAKFKVLHWGRRRGKSRFALWETIINYINVQEIPPPEGLVPQFHAWVVSPSQPQATQAWNELKALIPPALVRNISEDERSISLGHPAVVIGSGHRPWGLIEVKSAHLPDSLQTVGLDVCWITEAQDVSDKAFEKVLPTLRSPGRMGRGIFEGIPPTYNDHWFQRVFKMGEDKVPGYFSHRASALDNPFLSDEDKAAIEADKEILPERVWRRMYLAEFSQESGYFTNIAECIQGDLLPQPMPGATYVAGLDLGRKLDPSVLIILDAKERKVVHHMAFDAGAPWVIQRESITSMAKQWNLERLVVDATGMGGDIFTSELIESGLTVEPYIFTGASREALLQKLLVSFERETLHFPHIPSMLRQLRAFQFRKMPSGNYRAEAPPGENDDEVFALALGLTACVEATTLESKTKSYWQGRYVPTQAEANSNSFPRSYGAKLMRQRRLERIMERQEGIV